MAESISADGIVLGAGIAGLSVADALHQKDRSCIVLDPQKPGTGASGSPGMLINPATGRRARKAWRAEECYQHVTDLLQRVGAESENLFYEQNGVVRPALTPKIAENFKRSTEKYKWADGWVEWLPKEKFSEQFPVFENHFGGLFVRKAMTVDGSGFIKAFSDYLSKRNVKMEVGCEYKLEQNQKKWMIKTENGSVYSADFVIDATGYNQVRTEEWSFLPLHPIKGQTATFFFDEPLPLNCSVSSLGYMAFRQNHPRQITVGSTYEHEFNHLQPDEAGLAYLKKKLVNTFPELSEKRTFTKQWSSVRVSVQDKKPVVGSHPEKKNLYIIGALGSKGLLMGRYMAEELVKSILEGEKIQSAVNITRF